MTSIDTIAPACPNSLVRVGPLASVPDSELIESSDR